MSAKLPEPPSSYSQTWASQTLRLLERALTTITGIQTTLSELPTTYQPLDATLTALAAANWAANAIPIGTGADTLSQTVFAANTFPARGSTGNLVAKVISDDALAFVAAANDAAMRAELGLGTMATQAAADYVTLATAQNITGYKRFLSGSGDNFSATFEGNGGTQVVALGNVSGVPTISAYTSGFAAPTTLQLQNHGGALNIGGNTAVTGALSCTGNATLGDASTDTVDVKGRIFGSNLHDNAAGLSGASYIGSGTYTPTITGVTNVAATTAYVCQYLRVGNVVTVSGRIAVDATTVTTTTEVRISLPIASEFIAVGNLGGTGVYEFNFEPVRIYADAVNNEAFFQFLPQNTANQTLVFHFTYVVL